MVVLSTRLIKVKVVRGESLRYGRRHVLMLILLFVLSIVLLAILLVIHGLYSI